MPPREKEKEEEGALMTSQLRPAAGLVEEEEEQNGKEDRPDRLVLSLSSPARICLVETACLG